MAVSYDDDDEDDDDGKLKFRHSAIVDNVVTYVYAKFGDDRLWSERALGFPTSQEQEQEQEKRWRPLGTRSQVQKVDSVTAFW